MDAEDFGSLIVLLVNLFYRESNKCTGCPFKSSNQYLLLYISAHEKMMLEKKNHTSYIDYENFPTLSKFCYETSFFIQSTQIFK